MDTLLQSLLDELRRLGLSTGEFLRPEQLLSWTAREELESDECDEVVALARELGFLERVTHPISLASAWRLTRAGFEAVRQ